MTTPARPGEEAADDRRTPAPVPTHLQVTSADLDRALTPPPAPHHFGRYRVLRQLGVGGMATVYLAHDDDLDRQVALKVPHLGPHLGPHLPERFQREARAAALLRHPNICPVFDVGRAGDVPFLTMAYIEGQTLAQCADRYREQGDKAVVELVRVLADAVAHAHEHGVIHRDLKPSNVMITPGGEPVIMDFGLARRVGQAEDRLTQLGHALGTPAYMPPEQVSGDADAMGPASDVYSLGVILYELLTGHLPFEGTVTSVLAAIARDEAPPLLKHGDDHDPRLGAICRTALAKSPAARFPSMRAFADALADFLAERPVPLPAPAAEADPGLADVALSLLRQWGWGVALRHLRGRWHKARDEREKAAWQLYLDALGAECEAGERARERLAGLAVGPALLGWWLVGGAVSVLRTRDCRAAHRLLDRAEKEGDATDVMLRATVLHTRGWAFVHESKPARALPLLHEALTLFGKEHFAAGRVLDTLGMAHASRGDFHLAREFYEQAVAHKKRHDDDTGLAVSHGQLGRLYLDWGRLEQAEEHFQADLRLAQNLFDRRGEAQMYTHLGQVTLARAERERSAGRAGSAKRLAGEAAGWLDGAVRLAVEVGNPLTEGYARKDRALVALLEGDAALAEEQLQRADELFRAAGFADGTAQVDRAWGLLRREQGRWDEATRKLRSALAHFEKNADQAEAARTLWELARTQRAADVRPPLLTRAYLEALTRAEVCRRAEMVQRIEQELQEVDHDAHVRHLYRRARGAAADEEAVELGGGTAEAATLLALALGGLEELAQDRGPEEVLQVLNAVLAELEVALNRQKGVVLAYSGDGLTALFRERRHAERGARAALGLVEAVAELNRPRRVLGLPLFAARVGVATGPVFVGAVGTYRKVEWAAVGAAVGLAARLAAAAGPGLPRASAATREAAGDSFRWSAVEGEGWALEGETEEGRRSLDDRTAAR
jgi:class 3 adenylate cyclase